MPEQLTSEMRRALHRMRQARPELGSWLGASEVPRGTAQALVRRGYARVEGSRAYLTDEGRAEADRLAERRRF